MAQILIPGLSPGTTYNIQVRAVNATTTSDWSPLFSFTTLADTLAPAPITSLSWTVVGTAFHASWTAPTTNSNGSPLQDFKDYKVVLTANGISVTQYTTATTFDLTFEQNKNMFGTAQATVQITVYAEDNTGNLSSPVTATATNPAPAQPANFTATGLNEAIGTKWDAIADADLDHYELYTSTTNGFTPAPANLVWSGPATGATIATAANYSTEYLALCAVDVFGTKSTFATASATPKSSFVVDTTAPAIPTALAVTGAVDPKDPSGSNVIATVTWSQTSVSDLAGFTIRYRKTGDTNWFTYDVSDGSLRAATIGGLSPGVGYDFQIKSFDFSGNTAGFTATSTMASVTDTTAPSAPSGVTLSAGLTAVIISWTENTEADVKNGAGTYEVQIATNSGFTTGVQTNKTTSTVASFTGLTGGGTYFARVRAIDSSGNASAWTNSTPASTTATSPAGSDGSPPGSSPTPTILSGYGSLFATWTPVVNNDTVTYEVHLSTTTGFTPSGATKVAEVSGTLLEMKYDAAGAALVYGTTYYCKLIAKDHDGSAAAGAQGSGTIAKVSSGDINTVSGTQVHDGSPPASSPTPTLKSGIGYFLAYWTPVTNNDPVTYEVHMSTTTGFTPSASTKVGETTDSSTLVRTADSTGTLLSYGTTYFCKIIAKDLDGSAAASAQASGTINQVSASDIVANTITASQIAANTITAGQIAANTITASQIAANTITASQIAANTITASQIAANTITAAQIAASTITTSQIAAGTITGSNIAAGTITASNLNVSVGGGNIMFNSAFLSSAAITTYWGSLNTSSLAYSSTHAWFGTQAGLATANGTGVSGINYVPNGVRQTITQVGQVYSASIWVYPSVTTNMRASLEWWTATTGGSNVSTTAGSTISCTANTWTRITVTGTVPATATAVVPTFYSTATPANGTTFYFDAGQLETGDVVTAYGPRPDEVLPGTITATQIAANTITAGQIAASTITATQIAANTITASQIASATITSTQIAAGTITASNINMTNFYATAGTITNTLTIGASGAIQSSNYSAGSTGWQLSQNGLEINGGTIRAQALLLQSGQNMMPLQYADFEFQSSFYTSSVFTTTNTPTISIDGSTFKYNSQSLKVVAGGSAPTVDFTTGATTYNVPVDNSSTYIVSGWFFQASGSAQNVNFRLKDNSTGTVTTSGNLSIPNNTWTRVSATFSTSVGCTGVWVGVALPASVTMWVDGLQIEKQLAGSTTPSSWKPPSATSIDGGIIKTGSIQSTSLISTGQSSGTQPAWSINLAGSATFANALVRGHLIVGDSSSSGLLTDQYIVSSNYASGSAGYIVKGDGSVEFNSGTFRGSVNVGGSTGITLNGSTGLWAGAAQAASTVATPSQPSVSSVSSTGGTFSSGSVMRYYVTALDSSGNETGPSTELLFPVPGAVTSSTTFAVAGAQTSGGSNWSATTYYFVQTWVGLGGESVKGPESSQTLSSTTSYPRIYFPIPFNTKALYLRTYYGTVSGTYTNYIEIPVWKFGAISQATYGLNGSVFGWTNRTSMPGYTIGAGSPPASNTSADSSTAQFTVSWTASSGAASYNVYKDTGGYGWKKKNVASNSTTETDSTDAAYSSVNYLNNNDYTAAPFSVSLSGSVSATGSAVVQGLLKTSISGPRIEIGPVKQSSVWPGVFNADTIGLFTGQQDEYRPGLIGIAPYSQSSDWAAERMSVSVWAPQIGRDVSSAYIRIAGGTRGGENVALHSSLPAISTGAVILSPAGSMGSGQTLSSGPMYMAAGGMATKYTAVPGGYVGGFSNITNATPPTNSSTSVYALVTGMADTGALTMSSGRRYKFTLHLVWSTNTANDGISVCIVDGGGSAPTTSSTRVGPADGGAYTSATANTDTFTMSFETNSLSDGTHRFGVIFRARAGGTCTATHSATSSYLIIEDIGA